MKKPSAAWLVHCPVHPGQVIGEIYDLGRDFDHGWWCPKCKAYRRINADQLQRYLTPQRESDKLAHTM